MRLTIQHGGDLMAVTACCLCNNPNLRALVCRIGPICTFQENWSSMEAPSFSEPQLWASVPAQSLEPTPGSNLGHNIRTQSTSTIEKSQLNWMGAAAGLGTNRNAVLGHIPIKRYALLRTWSCCVCAAHSGSFAEFSKKRAGSEFSRKNKCLSKQ